MCITSAGVGIHLQSNISGSNTFGTSSQRSFKLVKVNHSARTGDIIGISPH